MRTALEVPCTNCKTHCATIHSLYGAKTMKKLSREIWIQAGFQVLDQLGYTHLSAEKIARRLRVTRGSFYHHFRNRSDFVGALLERWRLDYTEQVIAFARGEEDAKRILERYLLVAGHLQPGREVAIRAWAAKDPSVCNVLAQVDESRLAFARHLGRSMFPLVTELEVNRFARIACLAFIGFQQTGPHGRERFVELVQDVLDMVVPRNRLAPQPNNPQSRHGD